MSARRRRSGRNLETEGHVEGQRRPRRRARTAPQGTCDSSRVSGRGPGGPLLYSGTCPLDPQSLRSHARSSPDDPTETLHRCRRRRHRRRRSNHGAGARRAQLPGGRAAAPGVGSLGRPNRRGGRAIDRDRRGGPGGIRGRRHRAVQRRRRHLGAARAPGRGARRHGDRQLERVANGSGRAARREPGQPR